MGRTFKISNSKITCLTAGVCALALWAAVPASASVTDFRLPPSASEQQPQPQRQGPVAPDVPESRGPQPTPTPAPTQVRPAEVSPAPQVTPPPFARPTAAPRALRQAPQGAAPATAAPVAGLELPAATEEPASEAAAPANPQPAARAPVPVRNLGNRDEGGTVWPWALGGLLVLVVLGLAALVWWRRRPLAGIPLEVPQIERPNVDLAPAPAPESLPESLVPIAPPPSQQPAAALAEPLQVALEPLRLSLTLMNATLDYRLEVSNRGTSPITGLKIGADMISAHASISREEQLAGPGQGAAPAQTIDKLEPGESKVISGAFRVPFSQIVPIRQGTTALLLPLARFRVEAEGARPVVRTFVVGQPGEGSALQPFRLDLGPRIYPHLTQRAFA